MYRAYVQTNDGPAARIATLPTLFAAIREALRSVDLLQAQDRVRPGWYVSGPEGQRMAEGG